MANYMNNACEKLIGVDGNVCGKQPVELDICPYKLEIYNDDKSLCSCCKECRHDCYLET